MLRVLIKNGLLVFLGFTFSFQAQGIGDKLECMAGVLDQRGDNFLTSLKNEDFKTIETTLLKENGKTYTVRKYQAELEMFAVEAISFIGDDFNLTPILSITDNTTGTKASTEQSGQVRLSMSRSQASGSLNFTAACTAGH